MKEEDIFIKLPDGTQREVHWEELNQLKKDILWIYDQNYGDIVNAFVPSYSFNSRYWEYLTLNADKWFDQNEKAFYHLGSLMILLCSCSEYVDTLGGGQDVFKQHNLPVMEKYVQEYEPKNDLENLIKQKVMLGLKIAQEMTPEDLNNNEFFHDETNDFYNGLNDLGNTVIKAHYEQKINTKLNND